MHFLAGLPESISYLVACLGLVLLFVALWHWLTPQNYWDEIRNGNAAAALALVGASFGFALPIAHAAARHLPVLEVLVWAGVALLAQAMFFAVLRAAYRDAWTAIARSDMAAATVMAGGSGLVGMLSAVCL